MLGKIRGVHVSDCEECRLLGYKSPGRTSLETHYVDVTQPVAEYANTHAIIINSFSNNAKRVQQNRPRLFHSDHNLETVMNFGGRAMLPNPSKKHSLINPINTTNVTKLLVGKR
jgi:hypothetical protein